MPGRSRKHRPKVTFGDEIGVYLSPYDPGRMWAYCMGLWFGRQLSVALDRALNNPVEIAIQCWAKSRRTCERRPCRMEDQYAMFCGRLTKVTWTFMVCEPLRILKFTCWPTLSFEIAV